MPKEFNVPEPGEILKGILVSGRTLKQFAAMNDVIYAGRENGTIRSKISCWEHREQFFAMADRMHVKNGKVELKDAEAGIHEGQCKSPICLRLAQAYFETLSPSTEEQSEEMREFLIGLRRELITGKEIEGVRGKSVGDPPLLIEKAVDISHLCVCQNNDDVRITYLSNKDDLVIRFSIDHNNSSGTSILFGMRGLQPEDISSPASFMGIDQNILHEIAHVNVPDSTEFGDIK